MTFEEWCADNCPEFQRTQYSAGDIEANVRSVAESAWQASRRAALEEAANACEALNDDPKSWGTPTDCVDAIRALAASDSDGGKS